MEFGLGCCLVSLSHTSKWSWNVWYQILAELLSLQ